MKYRILVPIFLISAILQTSILNIFTVWGVSINLPLCFFILFTSIYAREEKTVIASLMSIIFMDIVAGRGFGILIVDYMMIAMFIIILKGFFNFESRISVVIFTVFSTAIFHLVSYLLNAMIYGGTFKAAYIMKIIIVSAVVNTITALLLYQVIKKWFTNKRGRTRYERYEII